MSREISEFKKKETKALKMREISRLKNYKFMSERLNSRSDVTLDKQRMEAVCG